MKGSQITPGAPWRIQVTEADRRRLTAAGAPKGWLPLKGAAQARLLKRVFDINIVHCPHCGGKMKIIAAIEEPTVIAKILTYLGLPARVPPRSPTQDFSLFATA